MYDNQFDFDDASNEWRKNKKQQPNGRFEYICNYIHTNGKQCRRSTIASVIKNNYIYGFGGYTFDKYTHHPNKNYYCKRHINRRPFIVS
jgi:hypothetical protein